MEVNLILSVGECVSILFLLVLSIKYRNTTTEWKHFVVLIIALIVSTASLLYTATQLLCNN